MDKSTLHIINGDSLYNSVLDIENNHTIAVWREMLCDGPVKSNLCKETFVNTRVEFLEKEYKSNLEHYKEQFASQLELIQNTSCSTIVLWFEYDLFCHINMVACLSYLKRIKRKEPVYLVCSGRIKGSPSLKGLGELTKEQLLTHYEEKVLLSKHDIDIAHYIWMLYAKGKVRKLKPSLGEGTSFTYLTNCLAALRERFPDSQTGLNTLEFNALSLLQKHMIKSKNQWCGYILSNQGYYGFGDSQIFKIIDRLSLFYDESDTGITLSTQGKQVLFDNYNFYYDLKDETMLGGTPKYQYVYDRKTNKLIKHK